MCNCIATINELLEENTKNARIATPSIINSQLQNVGVNRTLVLLQKTDPTKRTKLIEMAADYCPFCGESY